MRGGSSGGRGRSTSPALEAAAALLAGEHDFRAFTPTETRHEVFRRRAAPRGRDGDRLDFTITADGFLRHMVRTLVGTMLEAGPDAPERIESLLGGRPRTEAALPRHLGASISSRCAYCSLATITGCASVSSSSTSTAR